MNLKQQMAADISAVFLNLGEFAENCTYYPNGGATGFAAIVALGDIADQVVMADNGELERRRMMALGLLAALVSGIGTITANPRNPRRGDWILFVAPADQSILGTWTIESANPDNGGGVNIQLVKENRQAAGAKGVMQI